MNKSFQENQQALSYYITIIFMPWFCSKAPVSDVSIIVISRVILEAEQGL